MTPPRVVFFGYHTIGARGLAVLLKQGMDVAAVVTHADAPGEPVWFESVADLARAHSLPVYLPASPNAPEMRALFASLGADLFVSVFYRRLLGRELLALPRVAAVNLHGSLLPKYRGRTPLNWAIVNGERETGVTLHHMSAEADAGDIVAQRAVPIGPDDTALVVYGRLVEAAEGLLAEMLPLLLAGRAPRRPQDHGAATVYGRRRPEDGRFDWRWPAARIHNLVRAVTHPYPGAFAAWRGGRLFVWETRLGEGAGGMPGRIVAARDEGVLVEAGAGRLLLRSVQADGVPEMPARDFLEREGLRMGDLLCR